MIRSKIENHLDKLYDESKLTGCANEVFIPENEDELINLVRDFIKKETPFTVQGGKTSITGSSVPYNCDIVCLEKLNNEPCKVDGYDNRVLCQCGVRFDDFLAYINKNFPSHFFAPNPTEKGATIGGLISTNAKGTNYGKYGDFLSKLCSVKVLLPNGEIATFKKGEKLKDYADLFEKCAFDFSSSSKLKLYPTILNFDENTDILQLFAGSESILGVILQAELLLDKRIENKYGVFFFFNNNNAISFLDSIKLYSKKEGFNLLSSEYFDKNSLDILRDFKDKTTKLKMLPEIDKSYESSAYIELENDDSEALENTLFYLLDLFSQFGGNENDTWAGVGDDEIEKFQVLRHCLPEAINVLVEQSKNTVKSITKLACDFKLDNNFDKLLQMYYDASNRVKTIIFGHYGDNHLHVNLLPSSDNELNIAYEIIDNLAYFLSENGGCVAFENGIGKLKKQLIEKFVPQNSIENAIKLKLYFDKNNIFNKDNMFTIK